ncbi:ATP-binding protein [Candidatus Woesearchaeota archaeon]|nr:ATP-binding protein [Candidatus Woesearchaeota archaeon]
MENPNRQEELQKYLYAKIAQAPELAKGKISLNEKPLPLRQASIRLQNYASSFLKGARNNRVIILPGLRGTGKTTMLLQLYSFLTAVGNVPHERVLYFSADELREYLDASISETLKIYFEDILKTTPVFLRESTIILIDEAHFDANWGAIAKILYDQSKNIFLAITGSSALSIEISPDLSRRSIKEKVFPLSFSEYLLLKHGLEIDEEISTVLKSLVFSLGPHNLEEASKKEVEMLNYSSKIGRELKQEFLSYLSLNDLPFSLGIEEKIVYGQIISMIDRIIDKDIFSIQSFKSESRETIKRIIYFLATQNPGGTSDAKLAAYLGVSSKQVRNILDVLEKAHLVFSVKPYGGAGKIVRKSWKYYFLSTSINASVRYALGTFDKNSREMLGVFMESMVASYLIRMRETANLPTGIFYDADDHGVDFIIHDGKENIIPIEVSYGRKDKGQIERAIKKYNSKYGIIIGDCPNIRKEGNIIYIPFTTFSMI